MSHALALRHRVVDAIRQERRGAIDRPELLRVVDEYRAAIRAYGQEHPWRRLRVPSAAYLIRALG